MGQSQPTAVEEPPQVIRIPSRDQIAEPPMARNESREAPSLADEPGFGETHDVEGSLPESREVAGLWYGR